MRFRIERELAIDITVFLLRVIPGFMFIQAGGMKLFGWFDLMPDGPVSPFTQMWFGGVLEVFGGAAIMLGLFTRPIAFILSGEMAVAYWQFHAPEAIWPILNQGLPAVLYCFIWLFFAAYGAGRWSIDEFIRKSFSKQRDSAEKN